MGAGRRDFMRLGTLAAGTLAGLDASTRRANAATRMMPTGVQQTHAAQPPVDSARVVQALALPVLRRELFASPVTIASVELLKAARSVSRARAIGRRRDRPRGGPSRRPGDDVADLDPSRRALLRRQGRSRSRGADRRRLPHELQLQVAGAAVLGPGRQRRARGSRSSRAGCTKAARRPPRRRARRDISVYRASGNRGNTPEAELAYLAAARRGDRRTRDQVPARRADALRRRVDPTRPRADSADAQDLR